MLFVEFLLFNLHTNQLLNNIIPTKKYLCNCMKKKKKKSTDKTQLNGFFCVYFFWVGKIIYNNNNNQIFLLLLKAHCLNCFNGSLTNHNNNLKTVENNSFNIVYSMSL